jgi:hypothetical protein
VTTSAFAPSAATVTTASVLPPEVEAQFAAARKVAGAVLFEGYVLYPYRASAAKNRLRWQFGVLVPPGWGADSGEHSFQRTECLMEPRGEAAMYVELRFLRARRRTVQRVEPDGAHRNVPELELEDRVLTAWDEGHEERVQLAVPLSALAGEGTTVEFSRPACEDSESVADAGGRTVGRLLRRSEEVRGSIQLTAADVPGPYATQRLTAVVQNTTGWAQPSDAVADREAALPRSLVSAHLLLGLSSGSFLSMADPPEWAKAAASECRNLRTWPVLAGVDGRRDVLLSSPIILEDHPALAPESPGALYDATEIDEILALRTATLTDREKREARGTDDRAAAVIDLADSMPPEVLERLHGAIRNLREITGPDPFGSPPDFPELRELRDAEEPRDLEDAPAPTRPETPWWDPATDQGFDPASDRIMVDGRSVGAGSRVVLRPGLRRTDAQDLFLHGRSALVEAVIHDVDGCVHLAVTVEDDPGADIRREQGRFLYFQPDEVTVLEET